MPFGNKKIFYRIFPVHFCHTLKNNTPLETFQSLKLRILQEKILSISLKLNFPPNTLGCYGLKSRFFGRGVGRLYIKNKRNHLRGNQLPPVPESKAMYLSFSLFLGATKEPPIAFAFPVFFRATYSPLWQLSRSLEDFDYNAPKDAS